MKILPCLIIPASFKFVRVNSVLAEFCLCKSIFTKWAVESSAFFQGENCSLLCPWAGAEGLVVFWLAVWTFGLMSQYGWVWWAIVLKYYSLFLTYSIFRYSLISFASLLLDYTLTPNSDSRSSHNRSAGHGILRSSNSCFLWSMFSQSLWGLIASRYTLSPTRGTHQRHFPSC